MTQRSFRPLAVNLLIVMCVLLLGGSQAAADSDAASGASMEKFEQGKHAFKAGHFVEALAAFEASMQIEPSPNTRFQIARCYIALGKIASAYSNFKRAAKEAEDRVMATHDKRYAATRDAALAEVRELQGKVPRIELRVPSDVPRDFSMQIDGSEVPAAAWNAPMEIDAGKHEVVSSGPRLKRGVISFEIQAQEHTILEVPVVRLPTSTVSIELRTRPAGLSIALDGQPLAPDQFDRPQCVDVGTHKLVASAPGYLDSVWEGFLQDGERRSIPVEFRSGSSGPPKVVTFVLAGATVAALSVAIGFGVKAKSASDDQQMLVPLLRDPMVQDSIRTDAILANVFFGVTGLLAINTVIIAATTKWRARPAPAKSGGDSSPARAAVLIPGAAQLSLIGRY